MKISSQPAYSLKQLVTYFFRLGYSGFGGPVALVGYMHRDLVEERKWISEEEYKEGLALAQLADHTRTGCYNRRIYRIPDRRLTRCDDSQPSHFSSLLFIYRDTCSLL